MTRTVAVLAAMKPELRPLVRRLGLRRVPCGDMEVRAGVPPSGPDVRVVAVLTSMGTRAASEATGRLLRSCPPDRVVVIGVAGGVPPLSGVGDLVVPDLVVDDGTGRRFRPEPMPGLDPRGTLLTSDRLVVDEAELARLATEGVAALDMETAAVAAVCEKAGVPWSVVRAISDVAGADGADPAILGLAHPDGGANLPAIVRFVATRPRRIPQLGRLGRGLRLATRASVDALIRELPGLVPG